MRVDLFDYHLPEELIAQRPLERRDASRLMVVRPEGPFEHRTFRDIVELIPPGALMVFNDARVIPARLYGRKESGGRVELLLLEFDGHAWRAMYKASRKPRVGSTIILLDRDGHPGPSVRVVGHADRGILLVDLPSDSMDLLDRYGHVPLPPYIRRDDTEEDRTRYQTVFAKKPGAVAAPTAGLHFTEEILETLRNKGVQIRYLTLYVGLGTFAPVKVEDTEEHDMHEEAYEIPEELAEMVNSWDGPIIAVGTTSLRALEASAVGPRRIMPGAFRTRLFITPGYTFKVVDGLVTNFHLPRSTLLMLVAAFMGRERILEAYEEAVRLRYRFFSYGDAMLLDRWSTHSS